MNSPFQLCCYSICRGVYLRRSFFPQYLYRRARLVLDYRSRVTVMYTDCLTGGIFYTSPDSVYYLPLLLTWNWWQIQTNVIKVYSKSKRLTFRVCSDNCLTLDHQLLSFWLFFFRFLTLLEIPFSSVLYLPPPPAKLTPNTQTQTSILVIVLFCTAKQTRKDYVTLQPLKCKNHLPQYWQVLLQTCCISRRYLKQKPKSFHTWHLFSTPLKSRQSWSNRAMNCLVYPGLSIASTKTQQQSLGMNVSNMNRLWTLYTEHVRHWLLNCDCCLLIT